MRYQHILEMATKFATTAVYQNPAHEEYNAQRERFAWFYTEMRKQLGHIVNELGGEIKTLRIREFDAHMTRLLHKVHDDLIKILGKINEDAPYIAAGELVHYVSEKPNKAIIDNLDFLAKHHLKKTNLEFDAGPMIGHPEMLSLDRLKSLAAFLRKYMAKHPPIRPPSPANLPPRLDATLEVAPAFLASPEEGTKH